MPCVRLPHNLLGQVPWQEQQAGVYNCHWGTDIVRIIVAGELPREAHNAPLHLFSASAELVGFGRGAYRQRSEHTSRLLRQLFESYEGEIAMPFTWENFEHWYVKDHFRQLTAEEQREALEHLPPDRRQEVLQSLPPEERLVGLSPEQIQQYLDELRAERPAHPRRPKRKK